MSKQIRGFALLPLERRQEIASLAGKKSQKLGVGHNWNSEEAIIAGKKGGKASALARRKK